MTPTEFLAEAQRRGYVDADRRVLRRSDLLEIRAHYGIDWSEFASALGITEDQAKALASDHSVVPMGPYGSGIAGTQGSAAPGFASGLVYGNYVDDGGRFSPDRKRADFEAWLRKTRFNAQDHLLVFYYVLDRGHLPYTYAEVEGWLGLERGAIKADYAARGGTPNDLP
jgi:hypothetical protein